MEKEIQIISTKLGEIRTVEIEGETYFAGIDVAKALGYKVINIPVKRYCKSDENVFLMAKNSIGSMQRIAFINEENVYRIASKSSDTRKKDYLLKVLKITISIKNSNKTVLIGYLDKFLNQKGIDIGDKKLYNWIVENDYLINKFLNQQYNKNFNQQHNHYETNNRLPL
jgi:hypothetical protein